MLSGAFLLPKYSVSLVWHPYGEIFTHNFQSGLWKAPDPWFLGLRYSHMVAPFAFGNVKRIIHKLQDVSARRTIPGEDCDAN